MQNVHNSKTMSLISGLAFVWKIMSYPAKPLNAEPPVMDKDIYHISSLFEALE